MAAQVREFATDNHGRYRGFSRKGVPHRAGSFPPRRAPPSAVGLQAQLRGLLPPEACPQIAWTGGTRATGSSGRSCRAPRILDRVGEIAGRPDFYLWGSQFFCKDPRGRPERAPGTRTPVYWPLSPAKVARPSGWRCRTPTVRASLDEGASWPHARVLHCGPSGYSCLASLADGTAACLYESGDQVAHQRLTFARFDLHWVAGQ